MIGVPKVPKPGDKILLNELERLNDLERQAYRFGLSKLEFEVPDSITKLPGICKYIYEANKLRRVEDEEFLKSELSAHGIDYDTSKDERGSQFGKMAYMLYKIAGCKEDDINFDLGFKKRNITSSIENVYVEQMREKVKERGEFMLQHPELDYETKEILDKKFNTLEKLLTFINKKTRLSPLEIFNEDKIPEYSPRKATRSFKSNHYRSLKMVLYEICLLISEPDRKVIEEKTNRKKISTALLSINSETNHMLTLKMRQAIARARQEFQTSLKKKDYSDKVDWSIPTE